MDIRPFKTYLQEQGLHESTIHNHIRLIRYHLTFFSSDFTQEQAIDLIDQANTISAKRSLSNTMSKWLQFQKRDNDRIVSLIRVLNVEYEKQSEVKRKALGKDKDLPTYKQLIELLQDHYETERWKEYCILYLLLNYHVRNMDMIADVVYNGRGLSKESNWFIVRQNNVLWKRNKYKTAYVFGPKQHVIKNKQFMHALQRLDCVMCETDNIDRVVKRATGGVGEATVLKIYLNQKLTASQFKKVSFSRGTDLNTLLTSYDIGK